MATCVPYEVDLGCIDPAEWQGYPEETRDRAVELAWATLRHLTGGLIGNCPVAARPCYKGCADSVTTGAPVPPWTPMLKGGFWYNVKCGCSGACSCAASCEVRMPGPVAEIRHVFVGGAEVDSFAYRLDNSRLLVRQDGDCWPECQDLNQPWDGPDAFTVIYVPGIKPSGAGLAAAGSLAVEYVKACSGQKCRLPSSVTSMSRQGVSMEFSQGMFPDGHTGIREVDAYVLSVNPNHLVQPARVWSPDVVQPRFTEVPTPWLNDEPAGPFGPEFGVEFAVMTP